jgi:pyruvate dehydrogenase E1 component
MTAANQNSAPEIVEEDVDLSASARVPANELAVLDAMERKVRWLSSWTIHNANHIRPNRDGVKVGGHQASCASITTIMTALYGRVLKPEDRVAVKPHASPVFHAINYLFGKQSLENLENFRAMGGAQSYPSRTKDGDMVDFSTGSVGLGAAVTNFAALTREYLQAKNLLPEQNQTGANPARMVALVGDAELDEGNVYEALLDTWKHDLRNVWWVIDYNRQSLDGMINEQLFRLIGRFFRAVGWNVVTVKYGRKLYDAFQRPGGLTLRRWFNDCENDVFSALAFQGGNAWREQIKADQPDDTELHSLIDSFDDDGLHDLMTDLGGHSMEALVNAFETVPDDKPTCFICYTVKGHGTPLAGHKDNHAGIMNEAQMEEFRTENGIAPGQEWDRAAGLGMSEPEFDSFLRNVPFNQTGPRQKTAETVPIPDTLPFERVARGSTQEAFGRILNDIAKQGGLLADRIVTTSPDVTVSTNLGGWVNQRGLFGREKHDDEFRNRNVPSMQKWLRSPEGQHIELGIAESDLFLNLAALGMSHSLFGTRLLPIGTLYDPFICRGLDSLNYACYQDARFLVVGTPSGITLAPEGGAHQSISTPMIGLGQPGLTSFEPAFADEVAEIMRWSFEHMQAEDGGATYLRLSTRPVDQLDRDLDDDLKHQIIHGGYWLHPPANEASMAVICVGAMTTEAIAAHKRLLDRHPDAGLLVVTSTDRLYNDWQRLERERLHGRDGGQMAHVEDLMEPLAANARLVTVIDGHPAALAWMGGVRGHAVSPLGVIEFGQSGDTIDVYRHYDIGEDAIEQAAARFDD